MPPWCVRVRVQICLLAAASAGAATAAHGLCAHNESYNPVTRECACLPGYTSADCSRTDIPACVKTELFSEALSCDPWSAASCECYRQCNALDNRLPLGDGPCFERP